MDLYHGKDLKPTQKKEKYNKIAEKKLSTPVEVLCKHFPMEFATYLNYCRALRFDDKPDYKYLRRLFRDLFFRQGYAADYRFDWTVLNYQQNRDKEKTPKSRDNSKRYQSGHNRRSRREQQDPHHGRHHNSGTGHEDGRVADISNGVRNINFGGRRSGYNTGDSRGGGRNR